MGWRKRRKNTDYNVKYFLTEGAFDTKVQELMDNRHRLLAPFPLDPKEVYRACWTDEQWKALRTLKGFQGLLRTHTRFVIWRMAPTKEDHNRSIYVTVPENKPVWVPTEAFKFESLPADMQEKLNTWIPLWLSYSNDTGRLKARIKRVAGVCQTYGQLLRIWPEMEGFVTAQGKEKLADAKVKSAYPKDALENVCTEEEKAQGGQRWEVKDEFKPGAFEEYGAMIAEALMLPEIAGTHVGTVT